MVNWIGDRISVQDMDHITTIVINPLRVWWKEILLTLWVTGFTFVGLVMIYMLMTDFASLQYDVAPTDDDIRNQVIYAIVFLSFWAYFEYKILKALLWYRFGKELIRIDGDGFTLKKSILSYGKANRYFFENMKEFQQRVEEETSFSNFFENAYWAMGSDAIVFNHYKKIISFGRRVEDKSARLLVRLIDDRIKKQIKRKK
jgi:hypothetical protein